MSKRTRRTKVKRAPAAPPEPWAYTGHMVFHEDPEDTPGVFLTGADAVRYGREIRRLIANTPDEGGHLGVLLALLENAERGADPRVPMFGTKHMPPMKMIDAISCPPADGTRYTFP